MCIKILQPFYIPLTMISEELLTKLRDKYVGRKISCSSVLDDVEYGGICEDIAINKFIPSWGLVVYISRCPVTNVDISSIQILK